MSRFNNNSYRSIGSIGGGTAIDAMANPLSYCVLNSIDTSFNHGQDVNILGPESKNCQNFMADYCAAKWDGVCEYAYNNQNKMVPNMMSDCQGNAPCHNLTAGQILLRNTAAKKYLTAMSGNCSLRYEPFDPTVASSPMISYWDTGCHAKSRCVPMYEVDPKTIDNDVVMNKILANPKVAINILINIYNTAKRKGTLENLKGTNLYRFFQCEQFQKYVRR